MNDLQIKEYEFNESGRNKLNKEPYGADWPVVYLIHNNTELYVGETSSAMNRFLQHLNNEERVMLEKINIIFDSEFNKSAILDIEQSLIQLFSADNFYKLQNQNKGQSAKHNYYQREKYLNKLEGIWIKLQKLGLAKKNYYDIKNSNLFKYSPYNTLTQEQKEVSNLVIYDIIDKIKRGIDATSVINGGAGTGKTIILINMIYKIISAKNIKIDYSKEDLDLNDDIKLIHDLKEFINSINHELKIGYVVPMTSIRKTLKMVFKETKNGLKSGMVIGPFDVFKDDYDILFVDEAHRLCHYKNIGFMGEYRKNASRLGYNPKDITQLDMIVKRSKYRVLVYDSNQSVKGADITESEFEKAISSSVVSRHKLYCQMRCNGGEFYTKYVDNIFSCYQSEFLNVENYDFILFDDVFEMVSSIKNADKLYGLCRNASGYSWPWISKGIKDYDEVIKRGLEDITIGKYKFVWNMTNEEFILSKNAVNEIGCIHTLQGYDLNYVGVILGREIDYDPINNKIVIDTNLFFDKYVKQNEDIKTVEKYIINSYKVIMTRGIKGCFLYAYNKNLKEYLKRFVKTINCVKDFKKKDNIDG